MPSFSERLAEAETLNNKLAVLLHGHYLDDRRLTIPLAFLNLCLDHHRAMILLMRNQLYGSAMALVRPIFEAMIKAHWVNRCACTAQVDEVAESDDPKFPNMGQMVEAVDKGFSDPNDEPLTFFQQAKKDACKVMNSYTHSGFRQLFAQFSGDHIEAKYAEEDLVDGVNAGTASVLMLGYLVTRTTGQEAAAAEIIDLFSFGDGA